VQENKNGEKFYVTMIMAYEFKTELLYYHFNVMTPASESPPREMMCEHFKYEMDLKKMKDNSDYSFEVEAGEIQASDAMKVSQISQDMIVKQESCMMSFNLWHEEGLPVLNIDARSIAETRCLQDDSLHIDLKE
jgi:hypothetical protein